HRMRVVVEAVEEAQQRLVDHRVRADRFVERRELVGSRELAVHEQVRNFEEARQLGELLDRVTAVKQHAFFAVDVRDCALAARGSGKTRVEREDVTLAIELRNAQYFWPDRRLADGKLRLFARGGVFERKE